MIGLKGGGVDMLSWIDAEEEDEPQSDAGGGRHSLSEFD